MNNSFGMIEKHLATFNPEAENVEFTEAKGSRVTDVNGNEYINMNDISCTLGYGHPVFTERISEFIKSRMFAHAGNISVYKEELIQNLMTATNNHFDKCFFAGNGGEVVDYSLKIARRFTGKDGIISFTNALHGRSFAGAFISGVSTRKTGFGSGLENVSFWEYPEDGRGMEAAAGNPDMTAAIIIEPYQALGGMVTPSKEYWKWLRKYTEDNNIVLILDEIQTGFGKTGTMFSYEQIGIIPDILLLGKGMSSGFGMGALLMTEKIGRCVKAQELSGGSADNDFLCSVVNCLFDIYRNEHIVEESRRKGILLKTAVEKIAERDKNIKIHGNGLFMGIELKEESAEEVVKEARKRGVIFGRSANRILMRPPLVITDEDLAFVIDVLNSLL